MREVVIHLISSNTKESLKKFKSEKGTKLGRPIGSKSPSRIDGKEDFIKNLLSYKVSKSAIARMLKVSRPCLLDFIKSRNVI